MQGENQAVHLRIGGKEVRQLVFQEVPDKGMGDFHIAGAVEDLRECLLEPLRKFELVMPHVGPYARSSQLFAHFIHRIQAEANIRSILLIIELRIFSIAYHAVHIADFRIVNRSDQLIVFNAVPDGIVRREQHVFLVQHRRITYRNTINSLFHQHAS